MVTFCPRDGEAVRMYQAGLMDVLAFAESLLCTKIILVSILGEMYYSPAFQCCKGGS